MSTFPDPAPRERTDTGASETHLSVPDTLENATEGGFSADDAQSPFPPENLPVQPQEQLPDPPPVFLSYRPRLPERIPHFGHVVILGLLALCSLFVASLFARLGVNYHLFGVTTLQQATTEIHFTLGTEAILYLLTLFAAILIFPLVWGKSFLAGVQWNGPAAVQRLGWLLAAATICFGLALLSSVIMPGPTDAPIDKLFRAPGAAWILFAFGVTFAPFFEEMAFRGFLLPSLCTAFDWMAEKATGLPRLPLDHDDHPMWSIPSMILAALITSVLFAFLHADQTGYSIGPFLLLMCVSMVLCAVRLLLRSLAASIVVHACYNFMLFSLMFLGTSGFRHLEKM